MAEEFVTIEINDQPVQARKGAMLIEVADNNGISIPRFCYTKSSRLPPTAACAWWKWKSRGNRFPLAPRP